MQNVVNNLAMIVPEARVTERYDIGPPKEILLPETRKGSSRQRQPQRGKTKIDYYR